MSKSDLRPFLKAIENLNSTLQKIDDLANTAQHQIIDLYELSRTINVVITEDIVPLSTVFPAEQLIIRASLTPPEPGAELIHALPKRTRKKKQDQATKTQTGESEESSGLQTINQEESQEPKLEEPDQ